jgi:hypothetical protein
MGEEVHGDGDGREVRKRAGENGQMPEQARYTAYVPTGQNLLKKQQRGLGVE